MEKTEKQKQARKLVTDYLGFLMDQEGLVRRVVDERLAEMQPIIDAMVDRRIREHLEQEKNEDKSQSYPESIIINKV